MNGTVAPPSSRPTAAVTCRSRTPSSSAIFRSMDCADAGTVAVIHHPPSRGLSSRESGFSGSRANVVHFDEIGIVTGRPPQDEPANVAAPHRHSPGVWAVPRLAQPPAPRVLQQLTEHFLERQVKDALWFLAERQEGLPRCRLEGEPPGHSSSTVSSTR